MALVPLLTRLLVLLLLALVLLDSRLPLPRPPHLHPQRSHPFEAKTRLRVQGERGLSGGGAGVCLPGCEREWEGSKTGKKTKKIAQLKSKHDLRTRVNKE